MTASLDGLVSGLSTAQLISQLMMVERQPQVRLQSRADGVQKAMDAYRSISTRLKAVGDAAAALDESADWRVVKATSSDPTRVGVTATAAATGTLTFSVERLAAAGSAISSGTVAATTDVVTSAASIDVVKGGVRTSVAVGGGTLAEVVKGINDADAGVTATAVQVAPGSYRLQLTSTTTGAGTAVTVDDGAGGNPFASSTLGGMSQLTAAADAEIRVGGAGGYSVTRSTNTISDLLDGVSINLLKAEPGVDVTVDVAADPAALADKVQKLVDAVNASLSELKRVSGYDAASKRASVLTGDPLVRRLQQDLVRAATDAVATSSLGSPGLAGVSVGKDGTLAFDKAKFTKAYESDAGAVEAALGSGGVASRLKDLSSAATATGTGSLPVAITGREDSLRGLEKSIDSWDVRLADRERALRLQFTSLETALSRMQSQGQWLSGQIAGML